MKGEDKTEDRFRDEIQEAPRQATEGDVSPSRPEQAEKTPGEGTEIPHAGPEGIGVSDMDLDALELGAIIDVPTIQTLMEDFHALTNMVLAILDRTGKVLIAIGWQEICTRFHRVHPQAAMACTESDLFLARNLRQGEFVAYKCQNQLWDVVTPLYVTGKHVGNIYTGQFFYEDETIDEEAFIAQADRYGFDRESYLGALGRVPRLSREKVNSLMHFLTKLAVIISELSLSNLKLARTMSEQQRMAETLRKSQLAYRNLFENATVGIFRSRLDGSALTEVNQALCDLLGYTREEMLSEPVATRWADPKAREKMIEQLMKEGTLMNYEADLITKRGEIKQCLISMKLYPQEGYLEGTTIDITVRKRSERLLRESEERNRLITDNITDIIFTTDIAGNYTFITPSHKRVLARGEEVLGQSIFEHIHPDDLPGVRAAFSEAVQNRGIVRAEYRYRHPSRGYIWLESEGRLIETQSIRTGVIVSRDITARKQADEDLRESEERFRQLFQSMVNGFALHEIICDEQGTPRDYRFLEINPAFEQLTGLKGEAVIGRTVREIMPDIEYSWIDKYSQVALTGKPTHFENYSGPLNKYFEVSAYAPRLGQFAAVFVDITERKQAQERLMNQMEFVSTLLETIPSPIFYKDVSGRYLGCNRAFEDFWGRPRDSIIGGYVHAMGPADITERYADMDQKLLEQGGQQTYEWKGKAADGSEKDVIFNKAAFLDTKGAIAGLVGIILDITERKRAEEALQESSERLSLALEVGNAGVWEWFLANDEVRFDERFHTILGYAPGELPHTLSEWLPYHHPDDIPIWKPKAEAYLRGDSPIYESEHRIRAKDGTWAWVFTRGQLVNHSATGSSGHFIGIAMNISERVRTAEELQKQHNLLVQLVETSPVGIAFVDTEGKIIFANTRAEEILGLTKSDIIQRAYDSPVWRITDQDGKSFSAEDLPFTLVQKTQRPVRDIQHAIEWPDGRRKLLSINGAPLLSATGEFSGMVATFEDITERNALEEEKKKIEKRLQQSYKMEAIGTLAGGIAHDFNNILSSVLGFAELAKLKSGTGEDVSDELEEVLKAAIRARDLVRQILMFSRQAEIKREPLDIVPLIKETLKFLRASLPATIEFRRELTVSGRLIMADPVQIHQILMNLGTNAAHAMQERGGLLDIRLDERELDDLSELEYKGLKPGRYLRLSVSDTGSGIPKEIIHRIFDPFFTTKARGEGTGMGLSVVHGIVKDMGGTVSVYSEPGRGTTFNVLLPIYEGGLGETSVAHARLKTGRGRILFVDDEEGVIVSGRGILEQLGYTVTATTSPSEALALFTAAPNTYDLVLTDLTMPMMTGLDLAEQIRKLRPAIPIVLCTGFALGISPERIREAGIQEMVMKPMAASELSEAVYKAMHARTDRQ